jgi:O-antigen/teichoic acid export membrane protein
VSDNLGKKTISGVIWSATERFSMQGVQFLVGIILARLLTPHDYGLIGMLSIFLAISQTFIDSGFSSALIQKKDRDETDYSTIFFFNILVGLIIYLILYFSAGQIAYFFHEPTLKLLTKVVSINIIINSFAIIQRTKLTISLDFKTQTKASLTSIIIGGAVGITLAYKGYGVWALVIQSLTQNFFNTLLLWFFSKWLPKAVFSKMAIKPLFSFGSKLLGAGLLNTIFNHIYLFVIGKFFNADDLGYYTRAKQFQQLPSQNISAVIQRVSFPVLSSLQNDEVKLLATFRKFIKFSAFIIFPLMLGLAVLAEPLIKILLTEKWIKTVPLLQLLCFAGVLYPIHSLNLNILNVKGRSDLFLKLEIIKKILISLVILFTIKFGIIGLIIGQIGTSIISFLINTYYTGRIIGYGSMKQIIDLFPIFFISGLMAISVWGLNSFFVQDSIKLLIGILTGAIIYFTLAIIGRFDEIYQLKKVFALK